MFIGLSIQCLDEFAIMSHVLDGNEAWLLSLALLLGGSLAFWLWICYRTVLSPEPPWQRALWIAAFGVGCWLLGSSPMFEHGIGLGQSSDYRRVPLNNAAHGAAAFSLLGSIWLAHPLVQQIQLSQERQVYLKPSSSIWLNRWVFRGLVLLVVVFAGRVLLPLWLRSSHEAWQFELCQPEHFAKLLLVSVLALIPLRVLALVNRVWFQFLVWPVLLLGMAALVLWLWALAPLVFLDSPETAIAFSAVFLISCVGVLCIQLWAMNILGFRVIVPRAIKSSAADWTSNEVRLPIDRQTMALAYVGTMIVLLTCLTGLKVLRKEIFLASYFVESTNQWQTSRLMAKCQAWYHAHPVPAEDAVAWEVRHIPLVYHWDDSIRMLVSRSLAQDPAWDTFRQVADRELPIHFHYVYPISNAREFAASVRSPVIKFDQAKRPLREYVHIHYLYRGIPKQLIVMGGEVTNADLDLLPGNQLEFVGCHFPVDTDFLPREPTPHRKMVFRDCTFEASAFSSLTKARALRRTIVLTEHEKPKIVPSWLIDAVLNGVDIEFPNANHDWTPEWLASNQTTTGKFVRLDVSPRGRRLGFAPPWEILLSDSPIPPLLRGNLRTDEYGQLVGIFWGGFGKRDIPTVDPSKLRERQFEVPWLVISGDELTHEAEHRFATLLEIVQKSRYIEFVDILDPNAIAKLSLINFQNDIRPSIFQQSSSAVQASLLVHLPWVETVVTSIADIKTTLDAENVTNAESSGAIAVPDLREEIIEAHVAALPALKKMIFLTDSESQPASYEWSSEATGKSITIEMIPSNATGTWRSSLGLAE